MTFHLRHSSSTDGKRVHEVTLQLRGSNGQKEGERERGIPYVWVTLWEPFSLLITKTTHSFEIEPAEKDYAELQTSDSFQHLFINSYDVD